MPRVVDITNGEAGLDVVPRVVVDITSVEVGVFVCAMVEGIAEVVSGYRKTAGTTVVESVDIRALLSVVVSDPLSFEARVESKFVDIKPLVPTLAVSLIVDSVLVKTSTINVVVAEASLFKSKIVEASVTRSAPELLLFVGTYVVD